MAVSWFLFVVLLHYSVALLDLSNATIWTFDDLNAVEEESVSLFLDAVYARTHLALPVVRGSPHQFPTDTTVIAFARNSSEQPHCIAPEIAEAYCIETQDTVVVVSSGDDRGFLFGIGRLLRELNMTLRQSYSSEPQSRIVLPHDLRVSTAPAFPMRGHMISYRSISNAYDAFTKEAVTQYIRDLAVWGTNQIELVAPDGKPDPHFVSDVPDMMRHISTAAARLGLNVSLWIPTNSPCSWPELLPSLPALHALLIPSGDPGDLPPAELFAFLDETLAAVFARMPKVDVWLTNQGFNSSDMELFWPLLSARPFWLTGLAYGPHTRLTIDECLAKLPAGMPLRHYPDVCHQSQAQFPQPNWSYVYAFTEGRESINMRAVQMAAIARQTLPGSVGFGAYSDGINDDVNKVVWSVVAWDPAADVLEDILVPYVRFFLSPTVATEGAKGLFWLERNWHIHIETLAESVEPVVDTLLVWKRVGEAVAAVGEQHWRLLLPLYRAHYDAHLALRARAEIAWADLALRTAAQALGGDVSPAQALAQALEVLAEQPTDTLIEETAMECRILAEGIYQSSGMQLSVPLYQAAGVGRGASLDTLAAPLSNAPYLQQRFTALSHESNTTVQLAGISALVHWGPPAGHALGRAQDMGYYDNLGVVHEQPHLLLGAGADADPSFFDSVFLGFVESFTDETPVLPLQWHSWAETKYAQPLQLHYTKLDSALRYTVSVVYSTADASQTALVALYASTAQEGPRSLVHAPMLKPDPMTFVSFPLPMDVTRSGQLFLTFVRVDGTVGGNGRGLQVSEVFVRPDFSDSLILTAS